jgi:hypothetical protein
MARSIKLAKNQVTSIMVGGKHNRRNDDHLGLRSSRFGDREARAGNRRFVARALGDLSIHSCSLPAPDFTGAGRKSKSPFRGLGSRGYAAALA